jgi:misacylated tRNA(Ala) deacylase
LLRCGGDVVSPSRRPRSSGSTFRADGRTHVANTREVGGIRATGYESKGRINKRIRIELVDAD